ncbi:MAG: thiolase family protein, partial [Novosphingobium sp.]
TSAERAQQLGVPDPVPILGFGAGQESWSVELRTDLTTSLASTSAAMAYQMAGLGPQDMDTAQLYDCFSIVPIITLEDYGFCKKGHGGRFVEEGAIARDGMIPLNTAGGLLSETGMPGMQMVLEGVRQVRGTAANQVRNVRNSIISTQGGVMQTHGTLIVGR